MRDRLAHLPPLPSPSHPGPVAHPAHGGPSRYEMKVLGYNLMQAMRFAVEEINNDSSLLPDVLLGYEMVDSCYMSNNVQPALYFLSQDDYFLPIQEDYSHYVPRVVAIIGPDNSESTKTVANFLSLFLLLHQLCIQDIPSALILPPSLYKTVFIGV